MANSLRWPEDESDANSWRKTWRSAFSLRHREAITTSQELSIRLAELAKAIRDRAKSALAIETQQGTLTKLMSAFQKSLMHDIDPETFADMYAQTIAYGLLSARITNPQSKTSDDLALHMRTNPFLKKLMEIFLHIGGQQIDSKGYTIDFDELGIVELVELLDEANMEEVVRDFGDRNPQEDPVIHFYESFLAAYDNKQKLQKGVFYTPRPVVSFIVRSIDETLRTEFGLKYGLADITTWKEMAVRFDGIEIPEHISEDQPFVQILDPATGTGTFLVEIISIIYESMIKKWKNEGHSSNEIDKLWNEYVPDHLLPRLYGYELLMAPYAIAHMKISLKLYETGYRFNSEQRACIYLTNALEQPSDHQYALDFLPALANEARVVNEIKRNQKFTVVVGNPPYSAHSSNDNKWINDILRLPLKDESNGYFVVDGNSLGERNPKWLNDEYVKFIRLAQYYISESKLGLVGYITNHGYLDNITFRGMRQSLMTTYTLNYITDLHGNIKKKEITPDGLKDDGVFDIQQGVSISICAKLPTLVHEVFRTDIWGSRQHKLNLLANKTCLNLPFLQLRPVSDTYLFTKQSFDIPEYQFAWPLPQIMPVNSVGIVTGRDKLAFGNSVTDIKATIELLKNNKISDDEIISRYFSGPRRGQRPKKENVISGNSHAWLSEIRKKLQSNELDEDIVECLYRPFDIKSIWYNSEIVVRPRNKVMKNMINHCNLGLITSRMTVAAPMRDVFVSKHPIEFGVMAMRPSNSAPLYPLYIYPESGGFEDITRWANFDPEFIKSITSTLSLDWIEEGKGSLLKEGTIGPEDIFYYLYAHLHSKQYRKKYEDELKRNHPRIFLTNNLDLFSTLVSLGSSLISLHLLETPFLNSSLGCFNIFDKPKENYYIESVSYSDQTVWIDKKKKYGFEGVSEEVWEFYIGGYQICRKWLTDRKDRILTKDELHHFQKIIAALSETIRIMTEIDEIIDKHGGWPNAFETS